VPSGKVPNAFPNPALQRVVLSFMNVVIATGLDHVLPPSRDRVITQGLVYLSTFPLPPPWEAARIYITMIAFTDIVATG
jgi:hypothetical protein